MSRWVLVGGLAVLFAWIAAVTLLILREPATGTTTPEDLGRSVRLAVREDQPDLAPVIDPPGYPQEGIDVLLAIVRQQCDPLGQIAFSGSAGEQGLALYRQDGSQCGRLTVRQKEDGRWYLDGNVAWTGYR